MSRTYRAFVDEDRLPEDGRLLLGSEESRHLAKVLRATRGTAVEVLNGRGEIWSATVLEALPRATTLTVRTRRKAKPSVPSFELAVALPKGGGMDVIVRQATELGVARISPLLTERSESGKKSERRNSKVEKWRRIAIEACKQSGNPWLPEIVPPRLFETWLTGLPSGGLRLFGSPDPEANPMSSLTPPASLPIGVFLSIGPEGGFSPREKAVAGEVGFVAVSLGRHILRVETAAVSALAIATEVFGA